MKRGLPGRRGQTFRPAPVFQGTGTGSLPQLALPHAGTTSRLGRTHEASHRCPYNSGVNATLPSITLAPGGVEKTTTVEHPRLRLLPGALLPAHWLGGGLLNDRLPGIRQALAEKQNELDEIDRLKQSREDFRAEYKRLLQHFMDDADSVFPEKVLTAPNGSAAAHTESYAAPAVQPASAVAETDAAPYAPVSSTAPADFSDLD